MRLSQLVGARFKERPAEATIESHAFLLRGGYARQVAGGIYSLLPPGTRVAAKIERILREEMDRIGGQEVQMPLVLPRELWEESGRYHSVGSELLRFKDRTGHDMVLAMTHEEGVVHLVRNEIASHTQLPFMVYQIQEKFRDEPRSRGGLIRVREFRMKDGYSFHATQEDLEEYYNRCLHAYHRIFTRCGLPEVVAVESDTGMMGGSKAHEFMLLVAAGEDTVVTSEDGKYVANLDVATGQVPAFPGDPLPTERVHTPGTKTIAALAELLGIEERQTAKCVFCEADADGKLVLAVVRGDREVCEPKLAKQIGVMPVPANDAAIRAAGAEPGFASPVGLDPAKVRIVVDHTVAQSANLVIGANEVDYHVRNFNLERDLPGTQTVDIIQAAEGDRTAVGASRLTLSRGIEVGNIFQLGTKYSESMGMRFNDADGKLKTPVMGCYGIGVGRLACSVIEARCDKWGPKWPISIAPWQVHICAMKLKSPGVREAAEELYDALTRLGIEVLYDDRDAQAGVQFAEADLLGIPFRLIVGAKGLEKGEVEFKRRDTDEKGALPLAEAATRTAEMVRQALAAIDAAADELA